MDGELLERTDVGLNGVLGDRAWAVRAEVGGDIESAKKLPALMRCRARYSEAPTAERPSACAEIELPSGTRVLTADEDAAARISQAIGHDVSLWPLISVEDLGHDHRGAEAGQDPRGNYFDAYPLLIMSQAALDFVQSKAGESVIDSRRFRPNFVVDTGPEERGFVEAAWAGKRLQIGGMVAQAHMVCPRCVMVTHGFDDLPKDPDIMRTLVRETGGNLGIYASVVEAGSVALGDSVEVLPN